MSLRSEYERRLKGFAKEYGLTIERSGGNHLAVRHSAIGVYYCSSTPSCSRTWFNVRAGLLRKMRDAGVIGNDEGRVREKSARVFPHLPKTTPAERRRRKAGALAALAGRTAQARCPVPLP